jgi:hypothetical protein
MIHTYELRGGQQVSQLFVAFMTNGFLTKKFSFVLTLYHSQKSDQ